jgi:tetratricopeptide (TPR) repeat protein
MRRNIASNKLQRKSAGRSRNYRSRPFWLPASNFYILAAAAAIAFFFFLWWILHEGGEEIPYVPAGIGASIVLGSAVFLREVILRRARQRFLMTQKMLDHNLKRVRAVSGGQNSRKKLSIKQNAAIIAEIKRKSEAALILDKFSEGHWEVFELCNKYLHQNSSELETVGVGSPRLAALRKGREIVKEIHKLHLLNWAEIESRSDLSTAKNQMAIAEKLEFTQKAIRILEKALEFYPQEKQLKESVEAVKEFNSSIKVSHLIESAEKAAFKGEKTEAVNLYRDALFFLNKESFQNAERRLIEENIIAEIEKIEQNLQIEN